MEIHDLNMWLNYLNFNLLNNPKKATTYLPNLPHVCLYIYLPYHHDQF